MQQPGPRYRAAWPDARRGMVVFRVVPGPMVGRAHEGIDESKTSPCLAFNARHNTAHLILPDFLGDRADRVPGAGRSNSGGWRSIRFRLVVGHRTYDAHPTWALSTMHTPRGPSARVAHVRCTRHVGPQYDARSTWALSTRGGRTMHTPRGPSARMADVTKSRKLPTLGFDFTAPVHDDV